MNSNPYDLLCAQQLALRSESEPAPQRIDPADFWPKNSKGVPALNQGDLYRADFIQDGTLRAVYWFRLPENRKGTGYYLQRQRMLSFINRERRKTRPASDHRHWLNKDLGRQLVIVPVIVNGLKDTDYRPHSNDTGTWLPNWLCYDLYDVYQCVGYDRYSLQYMPGPTRLPLSLVEGTKEHATGQMRLNGGDLSNYRQDDHDPEPTEEF